MTAPSGNRRPWQWRVTLDSGREVGTVEAESYEEAMGRAIALAARSALKPQTLHVELDVLAAVGIA